MPLNLMYLKNNRIIGLDVTTAFAVTLKTGERDFPTAIEW